MTPCAPVLELLVLWPRTDRNLDSTLGNASEACFSNDGGCPVIIEEGLARDGPNLLKDLYPLLQGRIGPNGAIVRSSDTPEFDVLNPTTRFERPKLLLVQYYYAQERELETNLNAFLYSSVQSGMQPVMARTWT